MKRNFLLLVLITASALSFAQQRPTFGVRGGVTSAGMSGDAVGNLNDILDFTKGMITTADRKGFFAGAYTNIPLGSHFSVEPAAYYAQKGYQLRGELNVKGMDFLGVNAKSELMYQYIDIPVLLKGDFSGFQVFAGPQVSYLLQSDLRTTAGVLGFNLLDNKMNVTNQFNRLDAGVTGGIGYQFSNGLSIMGAYDHGLTKVDANRNVSSYNRSFKVGLGFKF